VSGLGASSASAVFWADYANPSVVVDLKAAFKDRPCRGILPLGTGTLVAKNVYGTSCTIAVTTNVLEPIQAITVEAATDIAFRVYW
jgi:hypothetical protein